MLLLSLLLLLLLQPRRKRKQKPLPLRLPLVPVPKAWEEVEGACTPRLYSQLARGVALPGMGGQ